MMMMKYLLLWGILLEHSYDVLRLMLMSLFHFHNLQLDQTIGDHTLHHELVVREIDPTRKKTNSLKQLE